MDDTLEKPTSAFKPVEHAGSDEEGQSSGDEDQGPDWTRLPPASISRPVIPKRGEKDFEPTASGGSGLQRHVLDRSRNAMLDALSAPRTISSKSISYAVWHPGIARAHVTVTRGIHFASMGHSVVRTTPVGDGVKKAHKRLELLPEEALYLVERGAMLCYKGCDLFQTDVPGLEDVDGVPMTVQQAFDEMIGQEELSLEKYQVFAYLKRLGYAVTRTNAPNPEYPVPTAKAHTQILRPSLLGRLYSFFCLPVRRMLSLLTAPFDWWRPIRLSSWLHHNSDYRSLYRSLRFLPAGHNAPLHLSRTQVSLTQVSPYHIFYNVYKPSTPFKKTAPPAADYSIVVVNARTTPMPSITELTALFDVLPELPPPVPRKRQSFAQQKAAAASVPKVPPISPTPQPSLIQRVFPWAYPSPVQVEPPRNLNPFLSLKTGKKMIVIAAVDAGMISFFRFGQGTFTEWPIV